MPHYQTQAYTIAERAYSAGLTDDSQDFYTMLVTRAQAAQKQYGASVESCAVRIAKLERKIGNMYDNRNGNLIFAIIRDGRIVTIELRRDGQVCNAGAFGVRRVLTVA